MIWLKDLAGRKLGKSSLRWALQPRQLFYTMIIHHGPTRKQWTMQVPINVPYHSWEADEWLDTVIRYRCQYWYRTIDYDTLGLLTRGEAGLANFFGIDFSWILLARHACTRTAKRYCQLELTQSTTWSIAYLCDFGKLNQSSIRSPIGKTSTSRWHSRFHPHRLDIPCTS